jgi:cytochrome P450
MATNILLDLLSSKPEYYQRIREEAEMVLGGAQGRSDIADKTLLTRLHYAGSAIRESMRLNPLFTLTHKVVDKDGLTLPDGTHIRQGCYTAIPVTEIHLDERFYPNAREYHPFRFVRGDQGSQLENKGCDTSAPTAQGNRRSTSLVTASDTFMSFGIGRHTW